MGNNYVIAADLMENWNQAMNSCDAQMIRKMTQRFVQIVRDGVFGQQYEQMHDLLCSSQRQLEAWGNLLDFDRNTEYYKVFSYTVFWTIDKVAEELYQTYQKKALIENMENQVKQLRKSAYLYPVLQFLAERGEAAQGDIAKHLAISSNSLSNFLRRNEKYNLWQHEKYGKYNYYFLTGTGKKYYKNYYHKEMMTKPLSIQNAMLSLLDSISKELNESSPDVENVFHRVNERLGSSQALTGNELEKAMLRRVFRKIERKRRMEELYDMGSSDYGTEPEIYDLEPEQYTINDFWDKYAFN